jgi:hypothetical protein
MPVDETRHDGLPPALIVGPALAAGAVADTDAILPSRTTITPRSITRPVPSRMRSNKFTQHREAKRRLQITALFFCGRARRSFYCSAVRFLRNRRQTGVLDIKLSCSCPDCRELQDFSLDPLERIHRFRVKKDRRQHLHNMIDKHRLDMTHITDRVGSPQTLVCTKDRRTFDRRMKEYKNEIAAMRLLLGLALKADSPVGLSAKMQEAANLASG